jgi:hypothetical protein
VRGWGRLGARQREGDGQPMGGIGDVNGGGHGRGSGRREGAAAACADGEAVGRACGERIVATKCGIVVATRAALCLRMGCVTDGEHHYRRQVIAFLVAIVDKSLLQRESGGCAVCRGTGWGHSSTAKEPYVLLATSPTEAQSNTLCTSDRIAARKTTERVLSGTCTGTCKAITAAKYADGRGQ